MFRVLYNIIISPFGLVNFKYFFLADVITSMGEVLKDLCYVINGLLIWDWTHKRDNLDWTLFIIGILPFWFRFWQCVNKFVTSNYKNKTQFYNALKYTSKMMPAIVAMTMKGKVSTETFWSVFIFSQVFCTMFVLIWDLYMDWGLLRGTIPGRKLLRNQLTFPPKFYYACIILNTLLRFYWVVPMAIGKTKNEIMENLEVFAFEGMLSEAIRRTLWAIIRIENESFNNFEQYRTIVAIPPLREASRDDE